MTEVRMPTQKRSIEKRNRIIEKGFELMCENGYYSTTIPDIAKYSEVSVGIIYQYFNDKRDIFIEGVKKYSEDIMYPMLNVLETQKIETDKLETLLKKMIDSFIANHTMSKKSHEELMAMSHLDEEIFQILKDGELKNTERIVAILKNNDFHIENAKEKIHIIIGVIDNFCHEVVYHKHDTINYDIMQNEVINMIINMLK